MTKSHNGVAGLYSPDSTIDHNDVALSKLYIGQFMTSAVQENNVKAGDVFTATGPDDPDPHALKQPVRFHVLGLRKGKSLAVDGDLQTWAFSDPHAPADAWTTYSYFVALPEEDEDFPYRWLLTRTGTPAAKQINLAILKHEGRGPSYEIAFELTTTQRENPKGKYFIARVKPVEAIPAHVELAEKMIALIGRQRVDDSPPAGTEEPAI